MKPYCRRRAVLAHFGEALPAGKCGGCDFCDDPAAVKQQASWSVNRPRLDHQS